MSVVLMVQPHKHLEHRVHHCVLEFNKLATALTCVGAFLSFFIDFDTSGCIALKDHGRVDAGQAE